MAADLISPAPTSPRCACRAARADVGSRTIPTAAGAVRAIAVPRPLAEVIP